MPTSPDADADRSDDPTPLDGDDFLAANRRNRERIRAEAAAKAASARGAGDRDVDPDGGDADGTDADGSDADGVDEVGVDGDQADLDHADSDGTEGDGRGGRLTTILGAATAILAVAVVVLAVLLARASGDSSTGGAGSEADAIRDAKAHAAQILTYKAGDYAELDRRIREISTPEFADRYVTSSQEARKANDEAQASSTAKAETAGVVSRTGDEVVVLVALDQKVTTPQAPGAGDIDYQSRIKLTMVRDGDRWIVSDLSTV